MVSSTTIGRILRDSKLNDGTLLRSMLVSFIDNESVDKIELSVISEGEMSKIIIPNTTEAAFELLQVAYKCLQNNLQRDMGNVSMTP